MTNKQNTKDPSEGRVNHEEQLSAAVAVQCITLPADTVMIAGSDFDALTVAAKHAERLQKGFAMLARYFTSGNGVQVTEARIKADEFWTAFGM